MYSLFSYNDVNQVFPKPVLPTDEHTYSAICTPFINGDNTSYTGFI